MPLRKNVWVCSEHRIEPYFVILWHTLGYGWKLVSNLYAFSHWYEYNKLQVNKIKVLNMQQMIYVYIYSICICVYVCVL